MFFITAVLSVLSVTCLQNVAVFGATPVVIWHGLGKTCCNPAAAGGLRDNTSAALGGAYVLSLKIGDTPGDEEIDTLFMHPDIQIKIACDIITKDEKLKDGFNAIGLSQGGLMMRGLVQKCPAAKVKNLITLAAPHQGIYGLPHCGVINNLFGPICDAIRKKLNDIAYLSWAEALIVQAGLWHDPLDEETYRKNSSFLADINNERSINQAYITNLQKLEKFVMVKFNQDDMVIPNESSWFGFYKAGQATVTETLEQSRLFKEDLLGLKNMMEDKKLDFLENPSQHLRFSWDWFRQNIVDRYLKDQ